MLSGDAGSSTDVTSPGIDSGADANTSTEAGAWSFRTSIITEEHRAIPGVMFGGWGPHLGHLVRTAKALYWVDDACAVGNCNVDADTRLDYWRIDANAVTRVGSVSLPGGIQQNTGTVANADTIYTYGVGITAHDLVECSYSPDKTGSSDGGGGPECHTLQLDVGAAANYVGAAIHPGGARLVWLTNVVDGGGGSFRWYVNYGSGWNGPRTGGIGGYNDASYINAGFIDRASPGRFIVFAELVSGFAPNWTFSGGSGEGNLATANAVTFALAPSLPNDPTITTSDLFVDPDTGDIHVLARAKSTALVYLRRAAGSTTFSVPVLVDPSTVAGRFCFARGRLFIAHGTNGKGFVIREIERTGALDLGKHSAIDVPLPAGFEKIVGAYPEASTYQTTATGGINLALVAAGHENTALGIFATPP